jgi:site-specific recombinase XerD
MNGPAGQVPYRPANAGKRYPVELLAPAEVDALIGACSDHRTTDIRNRALIVALYEGGLRVSEALALQPSNLDRTIRAIVAPRRNGNGTRRVQLESAAFGVLERWLDRRERLRLETESRLFCTLKGTPLQTAYVRALLPRLARKAGIAKRVHAQGLRHAHAARLADQRVPLDHLQAALGHGSRETTGRYLRRISWPQAAGEVRPAVVGADRGR